MSMTAPKNQVQTPQRDRATNPTQRTALRRRASIAAFAALATAITGASLPASFAATASTHTLPNGTTCV